MNNYDMVIGVKVVDVFIYAARLVIGMCHFCEGVISYGIKTCCCLGCLFCFSF